jgi:hypothetical protein
MALPDKRKGEVLRNRQMSFLQLDEISRVWLFQCRVFMCRQTFGTSALAALLWCLTIRPRRLRACRSARNTVWNIFSHYAVMISKLPNLYNVHTFA